MRFKIVRADSFRYLKSLPENSIDSLVTDPPYGWRFMGKAWDGTDIEKHGIDTRNLKHQGEWRIASDGRRRRYGRLNVPNTAAGSYDLSNKGNLAFEEWTCDWAKEVFRVLKPGAHALIFCGPRTYHRMASGVEDAGFEIRDQLQWLFGSGFPKSLNLGNGWGTALKPANEPILLARKPLSEKTVAANVLKWGVGGLNIDASRVQIASGEKNPSITRYNSTPQKGTNGWEHSNRGGNFDETTAASMSLGRFPANLILDEKAAKALDAQSGVSKSKSTSNRRCNKARINISKGAEKARVGFDHADAGGASRFFYVAKTSKRERGEGNTHPTVKPLKLMTYLIRMITPSGGIVLDPFMGSGTTGIAAKRLGFGFLGIEKEKGYFEIAKKRLGIGQYRIYDFYEAPESVGDFF